MGLSEGMKVRIVEQKPDGTTVPLDAAHLVYKGTLADIINWNDVEHTWKCLMVKDGKEMFFHSENMIRESGAEIGEAASKK